MHYQITDWLGTKRMQINPNNTLNPDGIEESCSSWPFGDQLNCDTPLDASSRHFTGKERDTESNLDYFGARYYSSAAGRWISPDKPFADQHPGSPQTLNLYLYARNNPLKYIDTDGEKVTFADSKLEAQFMRIASESSTLMAEYQAAAADDSVDVQVGERGLKQNEQGSQGDATIHSTDVDGVTRVDISLDPYRSSDDDVAHEWGHEKDAREQGGTAFVREGKKEQKEYPNKNQHDEREQEKSADRFRDRVMQERRATREEEKRKKEQKKKEQKQKQKEARKSDKN